MNAVGSDEDIGLGHAAVGETWCGAAGAGFDADATQAEPHVGRAQRAGQNAEQIGAMRGNARRAEPLAVIALIGARDRASILPRADDGVVRRPGDGVDLLLEPERAQRFDGVGCQPDAGADLGKPRRLFAEDDFGALPLQRQSRGQSADAAAHN